MNYSDLLGTAESLATILTAVIAVLAYGQYQIGRFRKRKRLENYLFSERGKPHTLLHLVSELGMTESEIIDAAFRSRDIVRLPRPDQYGLPGVLLLTHRKSN